MDEDIYSVSIAGLNTNNATEAWIRLITANGNRLIWAHQNGQTEIRLETPNSIETLVLLPEFGHILIGGRETGLYRSTDDGQSWGGPYDSPEPGCLRVYGDQLYICGSNWTDGYALLQTEVSDENPDEWIWNPILNFGEVRQVQNCPSDTRTAEYCDYLWEEVVLEAGFNRDQPSDSGNVDDGIDTGRETSNCGCTQGPNQSIGLLAWGCLLFIRRRKE